METNLWQLYDLQGRAITDHSASKQEIAVKGLLHGAAHLWLWRHRSQGGDIEILLQRRAATKVAWPGKFDKSSGGHLKFGEQPLAAVLRKTQEELGLRLPPHLVRCIGVNYCRTAIGDTGLIEHEYRWVYVGMISSDVERAITDRQDFLVWKKLQDFKADIRDPEQRKQYLPYDNSYYVMLLEALEY